MPEEFIPTWDSIPRLVTAAPRVHLFRPEDGDNWSEVWVDGKQVYKGHEGWSPLLEAVVTALGGGRISVRELADD